VVAWSRNTSAWRAIWTSPALNRLLREGPAISGAYLTVDDRARPNSIAAWEKFPASPAPPSASRKSATFTGPWNEPCCFSPSLPPSSRSSSPSA